MKRISRSYIYFAAAALLLFTACKENCGPAEGESKTSQTFTLGEFQSVELETNATVVLTEGQGQSLEVNAYKKAIENLELTVKNGVLTISGKNDCDDNGNQPVINIRIPVVKNLEVGGSGEINATNTLASEDHKFEVSGSGKISASINAKSIKTDISGSGMLTLSGNTVAADHEIGGSGHLHGYDLLSAEAKVDVGGSGMAELSVNGKLNVDVSGSGSVNYKGSPVVKQDVSGSGTVTKVE